jgi:hypothetical protein
VDKYKPFFKKDFSKKANEDMEPVFDYERFTFSS